MTIISNLPKKLCHCEPVRTLAWQSVPPGRDCTYIACRVTAERKIKNERIIANYPVIVPLPMTRSPS